MHALNDINFKYNNSNISKPENKQIVSKKIKWTCEEDEKLILSIQKNGIKNWSLVSQDVQGRTGKQCRERWLNQLSPKLNKNNWTPEEDQILIQNQKIFGNSWSKLSLFLPGRSSNNIKNRWSWLCRHNNLSCSKSYIIRNDNENKSQTNDFNHNVCNFPSQIGLVFDDDFGLNLNMFEFDEKMNVYDDFLN